MNGGYQNDFLNQGNLHDEELNFFCSRRFQIKVKVNQVASPDTEYADVNLIVCTNKYILGF
jgi:hypothetical protein